MTQRRLRDVAAGWCMHLGRTRAIVTAMGVALCGMACSGLEPGDAKRDGGRDAFFETSAESDGAASDASVERASTDDAGDVTRADVAPADVVQPDVGPAGSADAPPADHADVAPADSFDDDAANYDAAGGDSTLGDGSLADISVSDSGSFDASQADGTSAPDATVADAAAADGVSLDLSPIDTAPPVVINGNITEFTPPIDISQVSEIVAGPDGALWLPDPQSGNLLRMTTAGQFSLVRVPGHAPDGGGISRPKSLIVGLDGHFWFIERSDEGGVRITRMTLDGVFTSFILVNGINPTALAPGSDGNIWLLDADHGTVVRLTQNGEVTAFNRPGSSSGVDEGMIAGPDGNVWFIESGKIGKMTTTGVFTEFAMPGPDVSPAHITLGPDGNVWFTVQSWIRAGRITPGGAVDIFALRGPDAAEPTPMGITSGPDGNLWITHYGEISSVTPDGATVKVHRCAPNAIPRGITTGSDRRIWYVDQLRGVIGRIS